MRKAASEFDGWSSGWQPVGLLISVYLGAWSDCATVDGSRKASPFAALKDHNQTGKGSGEIVRYAGFAELEWGEG